jgi:hypothetical protein
MKVLIKEFYMVKNIFWGLIIIMAVSSPLTAADLVPGSSFNSKMSWLAVNAQRNGEYIVEVSANESIAPMTLSYSNNISITLTGIGSNMGTLSLAEGGSMFTVGSGVTLILGDNIELRGRSNNSNNSLIRINTGGSLIMNSGKISGNSGRAGSGVYVDGTFTMNGGEISGNTAASLGGGVHITRNGTFIMNGGKIFGNTGRFGGGVYVAGTFTMSGGEISSNTATAVGGGVYVAGTFTISGGEISGNTSASAGGGGVFVAGTFIMSGGEISGNTSASSGGGGVFVDGNFTLNGGKISGNTSRSTGGGVFVGGTFTMSGGEISGNTASHGGGGVAVGGIFRLASGTIYGSNEAVTSLRNTAATGAALFNSGTAQNGTFNGNIWNNNGNLGTNNNTIKVVRGELQ